MDVDTGSIKCTYLSHSKYIVIVLGLLSKYSFSALFVLYTILMDHTTGVEMQHEGNRLL